MSIRVLVSRWRIHNRCSNLSKSFFIFSKSQKSSKTSDQDTCCRLKHLLHIIKQKHSCKSFEPKKKRAASSDKKKGLWKFNLAHYLIHLIKVIFCLLLIFTHYVIAKSHNNYHTNALAEQWNYHKGMKTLIIRWPYILNLTIRNNKDNP